MCAAKKLLAVLALVAVTVVMTSATASAQAGPGNPAGGTSLQQSRVEGPVLPTDYLSRSIAAGAGWNGWLATLVSVRCTAPATPELTARKVATTSRRRAAR